MNFSFTGHEKFPCRQFWLKKGYDFVKANGNFNAENAGVKLGVGRNMVGAVRHWGRAFGIVDENDGLTPMAHYLFGENGTDPYLENIGTLWLLHYLLVKNQRASIYALVFNEFRKERLEFTKEQLLGFLRRKCEEQNYNPSLETLNNDIDVFIRNYLRPKTKTKNVEDDFFSLLIDLQLLQEVDRATSGGVTRYKIQDLDRENLPTELVLYTILDQANGNSISFNHLLTAENNVGLVYALSANGLRRHLDLIVKSFYGKITFFDDAGVRELQFHDKLDKQTILDNYYAR